MQEPALQFQLGRRSACCSRRGSSLKAPADFIFHQQRERSGRACFAKRWDRFEQEPQQAASRPGRRLLPGSKGDSLFPFLLARPCLPPAAFPGSLWLPGSLHLFGKGLERAKVAERKKGILLSLRAGVKEGVSAKSRHLREFQGGSQNSRPQLEASWNNNTVSSFKKLSYTLSHSG